MAKILILSASEIAFDSRILRFVGAIVDQHDLTTCSPGPAPASRNHDHVRVTPIDRFLGSDRLGNLVRHGWGFPASQVESLDADFDLVVANDLNTASLALKVPGTPKRWIDLHEWSLDQGGGQQLHRRLYHSALRHHMRRVLPKFDVVTTVGPSIARLYREQFGLDVRIVRNAATYADHRPAEGSVDGPVKLVHHGLASPGRQIERMIDAVDNCEVDCTFDLFLVTHERPRLLDYVAVLRNRAAACRWPVRVHEPLAPQQLVESLNQFDLGLFLLPNTSMNAQLAYPNKLFEFVQARLGVVVSPNSDMAQFVHDNGCGVVSLGYDALAFARAIEEASLEVSSLKLGSHACAKRNSFDVDAKLVREMTELVLS